MTGNTQDYIDFVIEQLTPIGVISSKRFFGGLGLCIDSTQFSMLMGNALFFVVDDSSRDKYIDMGAECFWYMKKNKKIQVRKYHEVPAGLLENQETLLLWAKESLSIAKKLSIKKNK